MPLQRLTIVTIWFALGCYTIGVTPLLTGRGITQMRWCWAFGVVFFWLHVLLAFASFYQWSLSIAYQETLRQTVELTGWRSGAGLYANFLFGAVWTWDAFILCWRGSDYYRSRSKATLLGIHGFLAFMFFNGTVIFGTGNVRWMGIVVTLLVISATTIGNTQRIFRKTP